MNRRTEEDTAAMSWPASIQSIDDLIVQQALRTPQATAVRTRDHTLSYHHLLLRSSRLARLLLTLGAGPEVRIALCLPRSPDLVVSLLAILRSGSPYVPLDPHYPPARLSYLLQDSRCHLLLTHSSLLPSLPALPPDLTVLALDTLPDLATLPDLDPASLPPRHPDQLAYLIYTSGSTGLPKGVALSHRGALSLLSWARHTFGSALSGVLASTSLCFDLSVFEMFAPLACGGQILLVDHVLDLLRLPPDWHSLLTLVNTVPSLLLEVLRLGALPPSVTTVALAGEPLPPALLHLVYQQPGVQAVYNLYGPSEDTTYSIWAHLPRPTPGSTPTVPIGLPLPGTHAYVLDPTGSPLPPGIIGELHLAGLGLARGYLDRPDLTAARFVPAPTGTEPPGARLYRTGDLVCWQDGVLHYLGRADSQIKLRGFRIELGEVEALLQSLPGVRQAVATVRDRRPGDRRLVAFVLAEPGSSLDGPTLCARLRVLAPAHLIPARGQILDRLPLTPNGKVDRLALPDPTWDHDESAVSEDEEMDGTEQHLAAIWREVLGVQHVRRQDRFFALGGHSLLALQVLARVRQQFGRELPLRLLFANPGLAQMAELIIEQNLQVNTAIAPVPRREPVPLALLQEGLWFLHHLTSDNAIWNVPTAIHLHGPVQVDVLEQSLHTVIQRHETLRTTFDLVNDRPVQVIAPALQLALPVVELPDETTPTHQNAILEQQWIRALIRHPFDLRQGPLIRAMLLRLHASEQVLLLVIHHIIFDGWSRDVLVRELLETYTATQQRQKAALPVLDVQYADYAIWQRQRLHEAAQEEVLASWTALLHGAPELTCFPTDHPRPAAQSHRAARQIHQLPAALSREIKAWSARENVTSYITVLTAFAVLLSRSSGQSDLVIGVPFASRLRTELEPLIGHFVNTLPLRITLCRENSFRTLLEQVRTRMVEVLAHQEFPFELIVKALSPTRSLDHTPLFQMTCAFQSAATSAPAECAGLSVIVDEPESGLSAFDLSLEIQESEQGLSLCWLFCSDLFEATSITALHQRLHTLMASAIEHPEWPVTDLRLMPAQEQQRLLVEWNATDRPYPLHLSVPQRYEARAEQNPHASALLTSEMQLSYGALNEQANQLAHYLRTQGVGPESCVGILAGRSIDLVRAQLAVLKADGAYVPLDPAYPATRLAFVLRDAGIRILLTVTDLQAQVAALPLDNVQVLFLDAPGFKVQRQPRTNLPHRLTPANLAYVIYTSGSTGQPKGVQITHRSLMNLVCWHQQTFAVSAQDRATLIASPAFDASVWECWPYLTQGAALCIPEEMTRLEPAALQRWLVHERISLCFLPTPLAESLLDLPWPAHSSLRLLLVGGDTLHRPPRALPFPLVNNYGPTEQTVVTTCGLVDPAEQNQPTIGRPIANTQVYVLDAAMQPVPVGVPGELYISGQGLARGYLGRPQLTAERFLPHPLSTEAGARCYRTGDLVCWRPDGSLTFLGRVDDQVKVRGLRIELREIESVLQRCPLVHEVLVVVREDRPAEKRLVCYVVPVPDADLEQHPLVPALRAYCREHLPAYMLPSAFVELETIPLSPNGKRDRRALPEPARARTGREEEQASLPTGFLEEQLAALWQRVLGVERVSVHDNFFDLGGHSLLAAQLIARTGEAFQIDLPLQAIFEAPTLQDMADLVEHALITAFEAPGTGPND